MLYILSFLLLEIVKRIASPLLYPVAYLFREALREKRLLRGLMFRDLLYYPTFRPLWFFLDDSIHIEFKKEYPNKEKYYPAWVWRICK